MGSGKMPGGATPGKGSMSEQGTGVADFSTVTESDSSTSMKGLKAAGNLIITGGTFIGTGASNMAQTFSASSRGVIAVSVGNQAAGTQMTLTDKNGNEFLSYTPELSYQVIILSCPDMESGQTYTLTAGTLSGDVTAA